MIPGFGVIGFRDPWGIRPLVIGKRQNKQSYDWAIASESVALQGLGFEIERDVGLVNVLLLLLDGELLSKYVLQSSH